MHRKKVLLPVQLVYVPYFENEPLIRVPITTGGASHFTLAKAIYKGICETIERDSFMIYWLNRLSPSRIDIDSIGISSIKNLKETFKRYYLEWHVFFLRTDFPTWNIMSVIIDNSGNEKSPAFSIGLSSFFFVNGSDYSFSGRSTASEAIHKTYTPRKKGRRNRKNEKN